MKDINKAKELLARGEYTCVLCKDDITYTSVEKGISPMLGFLEQGVDLNGFSAADKIVGKAAAMLFVLAGVKEVFGEVFSADAAEYLKDKKFPFSYWVLTDKIINRAGTGLCPMESAVQNIYEEQAALSALLSKKNELRGALS